MPVPAAITPELDVPLESIAHIIQVALTPVFLLSGIGSLLNVFTTRLARITDHAEHAAELLRASDDAAERERLQSLLGQLSRRTFALDVAVALGTVGAAATGGATFTLFLGALRDTMVASALFFLFGGAVVCTTIALGAFLTETLLAWRELRAEGPLPRPPTIIRAKNKRQV